MLEKLCNRQKTKPERNFTSHTHKNTHPHLLLTHPAPDTHTHSHPRTQKKSHKHVRVLTLITTHFLVRAGDDSREKKIVNNLPKREQERKKLARKKSAYTH